MHDIPEYRDFIPDTLLSRLHADSEPIPEVPGLRIAPGLRAEFPHIETPQALAFVCEVYTEVREQLAAVLRQRRLDRVFIDTQTEALADTLRPTDAQTIIGRSDASGRIVIGPLPPVEVPLVEIPAFLHGAQVTLFGPPDTAKMSINAMNAVHRRYRGEPEIVGELVDASGELPRWGADNEDSKTPIMRSFLSACDNLIGCFSRDLSFHDTARDRHYQLAEDRLSKPIKRIPGLALPDGSHLLNGSPLPLHLYDLVQHLFHNHTRPEALVFYVPKLENEEEAAYLKALITAAESGIKRRFPDYVLGSVRILVVFENPRAIFRIREMAAALHPHFIGGSLGWHDFLASTARLFKHAPGYRIPVKADPDIVINHIRESHQVLVEALRPMGAMAIGGMYGVLPEPGSAASFEVSMVGFIRDVVTQLKRGLDGFWVAHPDFVRVGIALVAAFRTERLDDLIAALIADETERAQLLAFVHGPDVAGLPTDDPRYRLGVLAADMGTSQLIANDDPREVRYNVFQALQYLADWLSGNGCVALPATMKNAAGETVFVRIMDDLATTERSRWEVWAEVRHGRVSEALFERILAEEVAFIQRDDAGAERRVAVKWQGEAARWYPIAVRLLRLLMASETPPEFATGVLLPFTFAAIREAADPWAAAVGLCPGLYEGR
jgi:malate synthase